MTTNANETITLALSKGRIFDETLPLLRAAGIEVLEDPEKSRKLILATNQPQVRVVLVRASDVPTYVQYGGADLGDGRHHAEPGAAGGIGRGGAGEKPDREGPAVDSAALLAHGAKITRTPQMLLGAETHGPRLAQASGIRRPSGACGP
jgi:hypothetical protein